MRIIELSFPIVEIIDDRHCTSVIDFTKVTRISEEGQVFNETYKCHDRVINISLISGSDVVLNDSLGYQTGQGFFDLKRLWMRALGKENSVTTPDLTRLKETGRKNESFVISVISRLSLKLKIEFNNAALLYAIFYCMPFNKDVTLSHIQEFLKDNNAIFLLSNKISQLLNEMENTGKLKVQKPSDPDTDNSVSWSVREEYMPIINNCFLESAREYMLMNGCYDDGRMIQE